MAVENKKSTIVGNADAVPAVLTSPRIAGGHLRAQVATVEVAAADDDTSVFRLFRLPSNAKVTAFSLFNDAITGGTSYDIGLYRTAADGGAAVDVDAFASAVDLSSGRAASGPLVATFEAQNIDKIEQELWQVASLTTDPGVMYDVALTANTVGTGAGTISAIIEYIS
jgi:hypothetical protein